MKELLVNNLGKSLIEDKGFYIADTSFMPALITKYTFFKDNWGFIYLINFIDADAINYLQIDYAKEAFYRELEAFSSNQPGPMIYFKVFITLNGLPDENTDKILSFYKHFFAIKSFFIPVIVNLSTREIKSNFKDSMDKVNLISSISNMLNHIDTLSELYNLEESQEKLKNEMGFDDTSRGVNDRKPYITYSLIAVNILMFLVMTAAGGTENQDILIRFGAKVNNLISEGQYWRLLTSTFIHIGLAHIVFNMYGLYNLGSLVEEIYGPKKYLLVYMLSALSGSISSFIFSPALSAGASGAIFGLFGGLLYFGRKKPKIFSTSFGINILVVLGFNLVYGFSNSGIDNFAHIGGLIGGYLTSSILGLKTVKRIE